MEVKELGHLVLYVRDIRRSVAFYRDVLGWRQVLPKPEGAGAGSGEGDGIGDGTGPLPMPFAMFNAPSGRTHHELLLIEVGADAAALPAGRRVGLYHFGLKIGTSDDELRAALRTLQEAGATVLGATDHVVTHSLYIADPDGNEIELYVDVPGMDWDDAELLASPPRALRL